jgi:ABC-type xylose transport system permease subunit/uncharacterized protein (DUF2141 family)
MNESTEESRTGRIRQISAVLTTHFGAFRIVLAILVVWAIFAFLTDGMFLSARNLSNLFRQITLLGTMSIGMTLVLVTANIDLSVGVIAAYTCFFSASMSNVFLKILPRWYPSLDGALSLFGEETTRAGGISTVISLLFSILLGGAVGFFSGTLVAWWGIPSFIATFATSIILMSLIGFAMMGGGTEPVHEKTFLYFGQGYASAEFGMVLGIVLIAAIFYFTLSARKKKRIYHIEPNPLFIDLLKAGLVSVLIIGYVLHVANGYMGFQISVLVMIALSVFFSYVLSSTMFGRISFALGANQKAAEFSGINIRRHLLQVFVVCGIIAGVSGFLLSAYTAGGGGTPLTFEALIACFIGLVAFGNTGGIIFGAMAGALIIGSIDCFMVLVDAPPAVQFIAKAVMLIGVAFVARSRGLPFGSFISNTLPPLSVAQLIREAFRLLRHPFDLSDPVWPAAFSAPWQSVPSTGKNFPGIRGALANPKIHWPLLIILAVAFYMTGISHESLWCDEAFSANVAGYGWLQLLKSTASDVHPPLYYLLLKLFRMGFGNSEFSLRLPSVLGAIGMICLGAGPISRLFGKRVAVIYAFIVMATPVVLIMAHEARMYSIAMFTVTASCLYGLLILKENRKADWVKFAASVLASAYLHYFAMMTVFFVNVFVGLWILRRKRALTRRFITVCGVLIALWLPWLFFFIGQVTRVSKAFWVSPFESLTILTSLLQTYYYKNFSPFEGAVVFLGLLSLCVASGLFIVTLVRTLKEGKKQTFTVIFYFLSVYVATMATAVLVSLTMQPILYPRYMIVCAGCLLVPLSIGISELRTRNGQVAVFALLILFNISTIRNVYTKEFNGAFRQIKDKLAGVMHEGDLVVTSDCHAISPAIHYLPFARHFFHVNPIENDWEFTFDAMRPGLVAESDIKQVLDRKKSVWFIDGGMGLTVSPGEILRDIPGWNKSKEIVADDNPYALNRFSVQQYVFTGKENSHESTGDLILNLRNIRQKPSILIVFVFDRVFRGKDLSDKLRHAAFRQIVPVSPDRGDMDIPFYDLPYGDYAIVILHDENNNHNWDVGFDGKPEEGYGVTNYDPLSLEGINFIFNRIKFDFTTHQQHVEVRIIYPPAE